MPRLAYTREPDTTHPESGARDIDPGRLASRGATHAETVPQVPDAGNVGYIDQDTHQWCVRIKHTGASFRRKADSPHRIHSVAAVHVMAIL
ncbi:hypothetical protein GCM10023321_74680 [Pseudonocardia eucalypti]|uniref:Uncharacterized protein n=1 Tax=Pseudonocardia eucalypti TaxID=648755 RepID=A0ABP9RA74_9PSEU